MTIKKSFIVNLYKYIINNENEFGYHFKLGDDEKDTHDFYLMCTMVFKSLVNNKLELKNIDNPIIFNTDEIDLDTLNKSLKYIIDKIETDRRKLQDSNLEINDYIKLRDKEVNRKKKLKKLKKILTLGLIK